MCQAVQDLKIVHEKSLTAGYVTISLGISCLMPTTNDTVTEFIEVADKGLYQAKKQGRNQFVVGEIS